MDTLRFAAEDVGQDPDLAQVGNAIELGRVIEMLAGRNVARQNEPIRWRYDINAVRKLAAFGYLPDLHVAHAKVAQAIRVALNTTHALLGHSARKRHRP